MHNIFINFVWPDEDEVILLSRYICRERNYSMLHLETFQAAYESWQNQLPTIVVVKRMLYALNDGLVFCADVRANPQFGHLPIIIGWADMPRQRYEEAYAVGANGCFGCVFDISGFFQMIEELAINPTKRGLVDQGKPFDLPAWNNGSE